MGLKRNILTGNKIINKTEGEILRTVVYKLKNKVKNKMLKIIIKNDKIEKIMYNIYSLTQ